MIIACSFAKEGELLVHSHNKSLGVPAPLSPVGGAAGTVGAQWMERLGGDLCLLLPRVSPSLCIPTAGPGVHLE